MKKGGSKPLVPSKSLSESQNKGIIRTELSIKRKELRVAASKETLNTLKTIGLAIFSNPITVGLLALSVNQILYKAGFYNGTPQEAEITGVLGIPEPIWFTIGTPPTVEQSKATIAATRANTIAAFIMASSAAWAASKAVSNIDIASLASIAALAAK